MRASTVNAVSIANKLNDQPLGCNMTNQQFALWFRVVSAILVLFGLIYVFFGLKILPVSPAVLLPWESALYGAIMMGWGVTLLLVGRIAFRRVTTK